MRTGHVQNVRLRDRTSRAFLFFHDISPHRGKGEHDDGHWAVHFIVGIAVCSYSSFLVWRRSDRWNASMAYRRPYSYLAVPDLHSDLPSKAKMTWLKAGFSM